MSKIGYVRCSSADQNPARQLDLLKEEGCDKVFSDMLSGKNTDRPGLKAMLDYIREGDVVFVESISRLARSKMFRCIMLTGIYGLKDHNGLGNYLILLDCL